MNTRVIELDLQTMSVMERTFYQGAIMSPAAHHASKACLLPALVQTGIGPSQWRHSKTNDYDDFYRFTSLMLMAAFTAWCETNSSTWQSYLVPIVGYWVYFLRAFSIDFACVSVFPSIQRLPTCFVFLFYWLFPESLFGSHRCISRRLCFSCTLVTLKPFAPEMHFIDNFFRLLLAAWFQAWLRSKRVKVWSGLARERQRLKNNNQGANSG